MSYKMIIKTQNNKKVTFVVKNSSELSMNLWLANYCNANIVKIKRIKK